MSSLASLRERAELANELMAMRQHQQRDRKALEKERALHVERREAMHSDVIRYGSVSAVDSHRANEIAALKAAIRERSTRIFRAKAELAALQQESRNV